MKMTAHDTRQTSAAAKLVITKTLALYTLRSSCILFLPQCHRDAASNHTPKPVLLCLTWGEICTPAEDSLRCRQKMDRAKLCLDPVDSVFFRLANVINTWLLYRAKMWCLRRSGHVSASLSEWLNPDENHALRSPCTPQAASLTLNLTTTTSLAAYEFLPATWSWPYFPSPLRTRAGGDSILQEYQDTSHISVQRP